LFGHQTGLCSVLLIERFTFEVGNDFVNDRPIHRGGITSVKEFWRIFVFADSGERGTLSERNEYLLSALFAQRRPRHRLHRFT
jgi:hypothetical protein